jgi:hypothetical protein
VAFWCNSTKASFRSAVDSHEHVEQALFGAHFGDVDVEVADGVGLELLSWRLGPFDVGQAGDVVTLEQAMKR